MCSVPLVSSERILSQLLSPVATGLQLDPPCYLPQDATDQPPTSGKPQVLPPASHTAQPLDATPRAALIEQLRDGMWKTEVTDSTLPLRAPRWLLIGLFTQARLPLACSTLWLLLQLELVSPLV